jgi:hypothetical protein
LLFSPTVARRRNAVATFEQAAEGSQARKAGVYGDLGDRLIGIPKRPGRLLELNEKLRRALGAKGRRYSLTRFSWDSVLHRLVGQIDAAARAA